MQITRSLSEFGFGMNTARSRENPYVPSSNLFLISPKLASRLEAKCLAVSLSIPAVPACAVESRDKSHACKRFFFERILRGFAISTRDAPDFVEVGEAGVAVSDAMRHQRCVQLVG